MEVKPLSWIIVDNDLGTIVDDYRYEAKAREKFELYKNKYGANYSLCVEIERTVDIPVSKG